MTCVFFIDSVNSYKDRSGNFNFCIRSVSYYKSLAYCAPNLRSPVEAFILLIKLINVKSSSEVN